MINLDACKEKVRPIPNGEFEVIRFDDNPTRLVKIWFGIPSEVKSSLMNVFEQTHISLISPCIRCLTSTIQFPAIS